MDPALSGDGRYVVFEMHSRLLPTGTDSFTDVYRHQTGLPDRLNAGIDVSSSRLDAAASVVLVKGHAVTEPQRRLRHPRVRELGG